MGVTNLGENIKAARKHLSMTQSELSDGIVTRNMLSRIENSHVLPSLPVLAAFSERLGISCDMLLCGTPDDILSGILEKKMPSLRKLFLQGKHRKFLTASEQFSHLCNPELDTMRAQSHLDIAASLFSSGIISECEEHLKASKELFSRLGITFANARIAFLSSLVSSIREGRIPLAFESFADEKAIPDAVAYFYVINLIDKGMADRAAVFYDTLRLGYEPMRYHINSRLAAAKFNFARAKELLEELIATKKDEIPAPFMYLLYGELEDYCTKTGDFKRAYECVSEKEKYALK